MEPALSAAVERGRELQSLRKRAGLTQRKVGDALGGMTAQAVSSWESGATSPEWTKLTQLDDLYEAGGRVLEMFGASAVSASSEISQLRGAVESLARGQERIAEMLRLLCVLQGVDLSTLPADGPPSVAAGG